ncbi:MAG: hypothetical protein DI536_26320 [Archangium gephyra]|uniref:Uncharacterized protein n=1 Tax=Archangium gephyra TaxID=48 RepID=A0A2W5SY55_9BACT|nr:MAG: hypothetical protein DI536_26320 [Archangium gephyra]
MGGALKSVGNLVGSAVKNIVPAAVKAIAGPATQALTGIVGDLFTKGGSALGKLADKLPGPLAGLAKGALGAVLPKLQDLATNGIEGLVNKLAGSITERFAPGVGNVTLPAVTEATRQAALANNNPVASSSSAATSALNTSNPVASGSDLPPAPLTGKDAEDIGKQNEFNAKMQSYQARLSAMNRYWEMISNVFKAHEATSKTFINNFR